MRRIRAILLVKCSFSVDIPSSQGGTSATGNIARDCFLDKRDFLKWATSSINLSDKPLLEKIQTNLSVVLRLVNSGNLINCSKMEELCKETYEYILVQFPWANITPSLHKLLSHSFKTIGEYNNGRGLQNLSKECLEACNNEEDCISFDEDLSWKPHFPNQQELLDLVRELGLTKSNAELSRSRLREWNILDPSCKISIYRKRHHNFASFCKYSLFNSLCYCSDVVGLFNEIGVKYNPPDWRLFIDCSTRSLKGALLHNGNEFPTISPNSLSSFKG
ncbi:hypothetical protein LOD99_1835 [Oopsacas minuta]|uniref:Uncharacterized protein n=1 Tax=Oopsacas minuta TaxID=111878 RepID=A0AAV7K3Q2_9METZ|nr:hypothetical protein LOD99_1835 [Oopsacas minuta]